MNIHGFSSRPNNEVNRRPRASN